MPDEDEAPEDDNGGSTRRYALEAYLARDADEDDVPAAGEADDAPAVDAPGEEAADSTEAQDPFVSAIDRLNAADVEDRSDDATASTSEFDDLVDDLQGADDTGESDEAADAFEAASEDVRDLDTGDPEVADAAFDLAALESLPASESPPSSESESMFADLVDRLRGRGKAVETEELDRRHVGRLARLEAEGVLAPSTTALVLARRGSTPETETCTSMLTALPAAESNVLLVWLDRETPARFDHLLAGWEYRPARLGVVSRSEALGGDDSWPDDAVSMQTIRDPADLTQVGITISQIVADWEDSPAQTIVCVDSISELLRHNDPDRVFRFLHILEGRLDAVDATAHFHLDSRDHELATIRTLQSLFDATIEVTDDGIKRVD